jgi:hypothetical protein
MADLLVFAKSHASTWEQLPPAGPIVADDDLLGERAWLLVLPDVGLLGIPEPLRAMALATTDGGLVTGPSSLATLESRLLLVDGVVHAYPVLADA